MTAMLGFLKFLFLDKRARQALKPAKAAAPARAVRSGGPPPPPKEKTPAEALAEAEARMQRLPPDKAQLIRSALAVQRARQSVLAELSDEEREKLQDVALKAFGLKDK